MVALSRTALISGGAAASAVLAAIGYFFVTSGQGVKALVPPSAIVEAPVVAEASAPKPSLPSAAKGDEPRPPQFDVVRVEPTGSTVVAGRAEPNAPVVLLNNGEKIAEAKADANGQFVILPPDLKPGAQLLTLSAGLPGRVIDSEQSVAASVPAKANEPVVAALAEPGRPTRVLTDSAKAGTVAAQGAAIKTADAGDDGAFMASGTAAPGASVRLYLNDSYVAPAVADAKGAWSLRVEKGMSPGHYEIRADVVEPGGDKVVARAQAPFDYAVDKTSASSKSSLALATETPGATVVAAIHSVRVERGDSLWRISRRVLGRGVRYTQIYEANAAQIRDPNRIWPGQVFVAPRVE